MNKYETLFIIKPDQTDEQIETVLERLTNRVERQNGKVAEINHWGNRRLAYTVRYRGERLHRGYYVLFTYVGEGSAVFEVERNLKILDATFRYLSMKVEENVDVDSVSETVVKRSEKPAEIAEAEAAFEGPAEETPSEEAAPEEVAPEEGEGATEAEEAPASEEVPPSADEAPAGASDEGPAADENTGETGEEQVTSGEEEAVSGSFSEETSESEKE